MPEKDETERSEPERVKALATMPCSAWADSTEILPPVGEWVLTHGSYGFVVACCEEDGRWQAQYVDHENGEPWLRGDGGEPTHWMPLPSEPKQATQPTTKREKMTEDYGYSPGYEGVKAAKGLLEFLQQLEQDGQVLLADCAIDFGEAGEKSFTGAEYVQFAIDALKDSIEAARPFELRHNEGRGGRN